MAHIWCEHRSPNCEQFADRPIPEWFKDSKLGIFIHWGPYSVPAWAETSGELGKIPEAELHRHNPYAEWYFNTIRFPDSPAAKHHKEVHGNRPYDDFIDQWKAKDFDANKLVKLFRRSGAKYVVPVTKHHDGVTLWDAPETNGRNTVHRGPKRDLVKEWADACEQEGLKFGVYYSTGIDWNFWPTERPWQMGNEVRPGLDAHEYNEYAWKHCKDLIDKYKPFVLWGDIDWPKAGVASGPHSVEALLKELYKANPEAVINDRFGNTHFDFRTVEYGLGEAPSDETMWQFTRGLGYSYGYNQIEDENQTMSGLDAVRLLADVASNGGDLLLNVGPDADGNLPPVQLRTIEQLGDWMEVYSEAIHGTRKADPTLVDTLSKKAKKSEGGAPWLRWTQKGDRLFAIYESGVDFDVPARADKVDLASGKTLKGHKVSGKMPKSAEPTVVEFRLL